MNFSVGLADLFESWRRRQVAFYFAWTELLARYRRSVLGPLWLVISTLFGIGGLGLIWGSLLKTNTSDFVPSLTVGLVIWQMISGAINEATGVFTRAHGSIQNLKLPTFLLSFQLIFRHLINLAHTLVVVLLIFLRYPDHIGPTALLAIPGLVITVVTLVGAIQLLGYLGARFRDLEPLIASFMPVLFFLSPVLYQAHQLGALDYVMELNPVAHWIRIIRDPVMGLVPSFESYFGSLVILAVVWFGALWITTARSYRLPYWV